MKRMISLFVSIFILTQICQAQVGLSFGYKTLNASGWEKHFKFRDLPSHPDPMGGWQVGLDYHLFGAKKRRIEFTPEFSYSKFSFTKSPIDSSRLDYAKLEHLQFEFQFNTQVYIFDINCDYKCGETMSLSVFLRKGFYFEFAPIIVYKINKQHYLDSRLILAKGHSKSITGGGCIGLGMDLPFLDKISLTPLIRFYYFSNYSKWSNTSGMY